MNLLNLLMQTMPDEGTWSDEIWLRSSYENDLSLVETASILFQCHIFGCQLHGALNSLNELRQ